MPIYRAAQTQSSVMNDVTSFLSRHSHLAVAFGLAGVIALMIFPVPAAVLDLLIAFSIASSILLLMLSVYIPGTLGLSTFPSLILMTTVLRLSLNIASTKQILLHAKAGDVIETFGRIVMGGSVIVGLVVFSIIAIVQFIVISKGGERIAEVGARFSLDALPGKQMSIEADLRAGTIDKAEAGRQRSLLQQESHMHGSMDGAMKFVKGDAIAAIVIALVNIIGGISIGVFVHNMSMLDALSRYTLLSVGDGMVTQIPSLLTSVAAGILITRAAGQEGRPRNLGAQIMREVTAQPMALLTCGAILFGMALIPGFPKIIFLILAAAVSLLGWSALRRQRVVPAFVAIATGLAKREDGEAEGAMAAPGEVMVVPLLLRLSEDLRSRLSPVSLEENMVRERTQVQQDLGLPFPIFQVKFDASLPPSTYAIDVQEIQVRLGELDSNGDDSEESRAAENVLASQVARVVRMRPDAFVGMQEAHSLFQRARDQIPDLCDELLRTMSMQRIAEVLRRLAIEGVSLRYLREIFESLLVWGSREKDIAMLCEYVRIDLGRFICHGLIDTDRVLHAVTVHTALEAQVRESVQQSPNGAYIVMPPEQLRQLIVAVETAFGSWSNTLPAILLTTLETRRFLRRILSQKFPELHILSYQELPPDVHIRSAGLLAIEPMRVGVINE
jgi:type III secretion protein V